MIVRDLCRNRHPCLVVRTAWALFWATTSRMALCASARIVAFLIGDVEQEVLRIGNAPLQGERHADDVLVRRQHLAFVLFRADVDLPHGADARLFDALNGPERKLQAGINRAVVLAKPQAPRRARPAAPDRRNCRPRRPPNSATGMSHEKRPPPPGMAFLNWSLPRWINSSSSGGRLPGPPEPRLRTAPIVPVARVAIVVLVAPWALAPGALPATATFIVFVPRHASTSSCKMNSTAYRHGTWECPCGQSMRIVTVWTGLRWPGPSDRQAVPAPATQNRHCPTAPASTSSRETSRHCRRVKVRKVRVTHQPPSATSVR